jgi:hypothetical protein
LEDDAMTRDLVLVSVDPKTGEIINRDGSVGGKVGPMVPSAEMIRVGINKGAQGAYNESIYEVMLAASKVDLSGAVVELPEPLKDTHSQQRAIGWNTCIAAIRAQMPKEKE